MAETQVTGQEEVGKICNELEMAYIASMQWIYHHEEFIARSCRILAGHEIDEAQRYLLLKLADIAERRALRYEVRLRLLGASLPLERDTISEIFWRRMFMRYGGAFLIKWVERIEEDDIHRLGSLQLLWNSWR